MTAYEIASLCIAGPAILALVFGYIYYLTKENRATQKYFKERIVLDERRVVALEKISDAIQEVYDV